MTLAPGCTGCETSVADVVAAFGRSGIDLASLGFAWARVIPVVTLVPAFGLRGLPAPVRAVLGLALAATMAPALAPLNAAAAGAGGSVASSLPWPVLAVGEGLRGLPVAIAAAVPLWAATMAGGVVDALRGAQDTIESPTGEGTATPLGVPLALLASAIFLATGGPARVVEALALRSTAGHPLVAAAGDLAGGITLAVALGGPLLAASVVIEVAAAIVARAAAPAQVHALLAPLRALGTLAVMAIAFQRLASVLERMIAAGP